MKKASLVILLSACSGAYAELPVVIDHSSYPASATPADVSNAPSANTLYELIGRLEQLQAEVQQLTGKVDEQAYRIDELKKHQGTMYSDFDERLQGIENKANGIEPAVAVTAPEAGSAAENSAQESASSPAPESAAVTKEDAPAKSAAVEAPLTEKTAESQAVKTPATEAVQVSAPEKQGYQQAYTELRNGHTKSSIEQFNAYLGKYPAGAYANNAQYWLGEAYRVDHNNEAATKAFKDVVEKYPNSAKVSDALLKLGYIEIDLKNTEKGREYLTRVITDYPKSPAAQLAAKKMLKLDEVKN